MDFNYPAILSQILAQTRHRAPKVSLNLARNIKWYVYKEGDIWGRMDINVPYAQFVNYGYLAHPNSKKLKKDYLFVQKSIRQVLKIVVESYGGGTVV